MADFTERERYSLTANNLHIEKAMCKISGKNSQAILEFANIALEGTAIIADNSERKRKQEEYYVLIDKIDNLEDKIIAMGYDLQEIYNNLEIKSQKPIELSTLEIRILLNCFREKSLDWIKEIVETCRIDPYNILLTLFLENVIKIELSNSGEVWAVLDESICPIKDDISERRLLKISDNYKEISQIEVSSEVDTAKIEKGHIIISECWRRRIECGYGHEIFMETDVEINKELLNQMIKRFEEKKFTYNEIKNMSEFEIFISGINREIAMSNLRSLYSELLKAVRKLKFKK